MKRKLNRGVGWDVFECSGSSDGDMQICRVDMSDAFSDDGAAILHVSMKSEIIATTGGNVTIPGTQAKLGLNIYTPKVDASWPSGEGHRESTRGAAMKPTYDQLLEVLRACQSALNTAPRFKITGLPRSQDDSYKLAAIVDNTLLDAKPDDSPNIKLEPPHGYATAVGYADPAAEACDECNGTRYPQERHEPHCSLHAPVEAEATIITPVTTIDGRTFDAVEIAACIEWADDHGDLIVERIDSLAEYQQQAAEHPSTRLIWTVYGHLIEGGVSCVADCDTRESAQFVGTGIARGYNLPSDDFTFTAPEAA